MTLKEFVEKLESGEVSLDLQGHSPNPILPKVKQQLENLQERAEMYGKEVEALPEESRQDPGVQAVRMLQMANLLLQKDLENPYYVSLDPIEAYCFGCGKHLRLGVFGDTAYLTDYRKVAAAEKELAKSLNARRTDVILEEPVTEVCEGSGLPKVWEAEIEVPSGRLVFANFFLSKEPGDKDRGQHLIPDFEEHSGSRKNEFDINCELGRYKLMQAYAEKNVGYAQMGNMGIDIFISEEGDAIKVSSEYYYDRDEDEEHTITYTGFYVAGHVSLSMWRWMCADEKVLEELNGHVPDQSDKLVIPVEPGVYAIKNYMPGLSENDKPLYAEIYRLGDINT